MFLTFKEIDKIFSKVIVPFYTLTSNCVNSDDFSPTLDVVSRFYFKHSGGCLVESPYDFQFTIHY